MMVGGAQGHDCPKNKSTGDKKSNVADLNWLSAVCDRLVRIQLKNI
jgi:hypothetical protein